MARTMKPKSATATTNLPAASQVHSAETPSADFRLAVLQSELNFYRNKSQRVERDMLVLRDALNLQAPGNGASLPSRKELQRLISADRLYSAAHDEQPISSEHVTASSDALPDSDRVRIYELEKQIHALQGVMRSPPVRLARLLSGWGRNVKRALRRRRRARP